MDNDDGEASFLAEMKQLRESFNVLNFAIKLIELKTSSIDCNNNRLRDYSARLLKEASLVCASTIAIKDLMDDLEYTYKNGEIHND